MAVRRRQGKPTPSQSLSDSGTTSGTASKLPDLKALMADVQKADEQSKEAMAQLNRLYDERHMVNPNHDNANREDLVVMLAIVLAKAGAIGKGYSIDRHEFHSVERMFRQGGALLEIRTDPIYDGFRIEVNPAINKYVQVPPKPQAISGPIQSVNTNTANVTFSPVTASKVLGAMLTESEKKSEGIAFPAPEYGPPVPVRKRQRSEGARRIIHKENVDD